MNSKLAYLRRLGPLWRALKTAFYFLVTLLAFLRKPRTVGPLLRAYFRSELSLQSCLLHFHGPTLLKAVLDSAATAGLEPFLTYGTLLGYRRDNGIIKHDTDIDLGLIEPDGGRLAELARTMRAKGFRKSKQRVVSNYHGLDAKTTVIGFMYPVWRCSVDIYCFYKINGDYVYINNREAPKLVLHSFPEAILSSFRKNRFLGLDVIVPEMTDEFLAVCYGEWRIVNKDRLHPCLNATVVYASAENTKNHLFSRRI